MDKAKEYEELFNNAMSSVDDEAFEAAGNNLIPAGDYNMQCERIEIRENERTGTKSISMMIKILGPSQTGRTMFHNFYCFGTNKEHNDRQLAMLVSLATSAGIEKQAAKKLKLNEYVGLKAAAKIKVRKDEGWDARNEISFFKKPIDELISNAKHKSNVDQVNFGL